MGAVHSTLPTRDALIARLPPVPTHVPSRQDVLVRQLPDAPSGGLPTGSNAFGVRIFPETGKIIRSPAIAPVCAFFNAFWQLMDTALASDRQAAALQGLDVLQVLAGNYRLFFTRFCEVCTEGARTNPAWATWQTAFSIVTLSTRMVRQQAFNEELLAREMFARYILGPQKCDAVVHADGPAQFLLHVSNTYTDGPVVEYAEVVAPPGARLLCTLSPQRRFHAVDRVWKGKALAPCRASPSMFKARRCGTRSTTVWKDDAGAFTLPTL